MEAILPLGLPMWNVMSLAGAMVVKSKLDCTSQHPCRASFVAPARHSRSSLLAVAGSRAHLHRHAAGHSFYNCALRLNGEPAAAVS